LGKEGRIGNRRRRRMYGMERKRMLNQQKRREARNARKAGEVMAKYARSLKEEEIPWMEEKQ
jgi:hypothetical protein